jgi:hypothetical protein
MGTVMTDKENSGPMRKIFFLLFLLIMIDIVHAAKIGSLPNVYHPLRFTIDGDRLYIPDQNGLSIYSMKDFKLLQKIGSKGEGPGEFTRTPRAIILQDEILLFSFLKFSRFKKDGTLLTEKRLSYSTLSNIYPLGDYFIIDTWRFDTEGRSVSEINIVDQDFKKIKSLYSHIKEKENSGGKSVVRIMGPSVFFQCNPNNIFLIDSSKGFIIEVFDYNGESVYVIEKELPKIKIPESFKEKKIEDMLKAYPSAQKEKIAKTITFDFPDYFPVIQDFLVVGDNLYVKTCQTEENREEYIILDTKGNILKKIFLPEVQFGHWAVNENKFYFLKDNDEKEEWELHCIDLQ